MGFDLMHRLAKIARQQPALWQVRYNLRCKIDYGGLSDSEEQAGFRAGRSTTEQILNLRIFNEKYIAHKYMLISHYSKM